MAGGYLNISTGDACFTLGQQCYAGRASGDNAMAFGYASKATNNGTFVWSDTTGTYGSHTTKTFNVYADNGSYFDGGYIYNTNIADSADEVVNWQSMTNWVSGTALSDVAFKSQYNEFATSNKFSGDIIVNDKSIIFVDDVAYSPAAEISRLKIAYYGDDKI